MQGKLNIRDQDRLVDLAIEGIHTSEDLQHKFGVSNQEVINILKAELSAEEFKAWKDKADS
ncbi:MAG: hypothetical protein ACI8Q1_002879 [Parvicella sp.]|jgi:uncharacterized protein (TIGR03643 family)